MHAVKLSGYLLVPFLKILLVTCSTESNTIEDSSESALNNLPLSSVSYKRNLIYKDRFIHFCTGSILSKHWTITAAHCFSDKYAYPLERFVVDIGTVELSGKNGTRNKIASIILHPNHTQSIRIFKNDLCLIKLQEPIVFTNTIKPVKFGTIKDQEELSVIAAGWGRDSDNGKLNKKLRYVEFNTLKFSECQKLHDRHNNIVDRDNHICAYKGLGTSVCLGDSGGPLFDQQNGNLVGVFSTLEDCSGDFPFLFVKIEPYLKWINNVTKLDLCLN